MTTSKLSIETLRRIDILFLPEEKDEVSRILIEHITGGNEDERLQFAALKYSKGNMERLHKAIGIYNLDWRELLMAAGFGSPNTHKSWMPILEGKKDAQPGGQRNW